MDVVHTLQPLLSPIIGALRARRLVDLVDLPDQEDPDIGVSRVTIVQGLCLLLFEDVLRRVPEAALYAWHQRRRGRKIVLDHGAVRTVDAPCGALPRGWEAFRRILEPLGYEVAEVYPLPRLGMTGRALRHVDLPAETPQFFVSELHAERFDDEFGAAVQRVVGSTRDPLYSRASGALGALQKTGRFMKPDTLPLSVARLLLPDLFACFRRPHAPPRWSDYETLLARSPEMAWIATEGNAFNHATDRVDDVVATVSEVASWGVEVKDTVETSDSGRVLQTATRATRVLRPFLSDDDRPMLREVPGSFFEFITREEEAPGQLDLRFDAGNATAIFKMTDGGG